MARESTRLLSLDWVRGPSGVYQAGRYVLYPTGGGAYSVHIDGRQDGHSTALDTAKNYCEDHRNHKGIFAPDTATGRDTADEGATDG